ncbi:hypothetical protein [Emticicia agri]|uniref:Uncharacterized protein n=1 Tax=Emticicia agri TaxID=2492393 RepID=A0A4Q5LVQ9_9BACT|nr:hypothetical protein [Emticicia agri]RYU93553.1 hypothetical protein EWM59_21465 [Emticicia agri]
MKKHPIDELFARKLAEHRQEPSQKAFEKFQARLQEKQTKRRGGVFAINRNWGYYAAAAGVVAALTIGILSQHNPDNGKMAYSGKPTNVETVEKPAAPVNQDSAPAIAGTETGKKVNTVEQMPSAKLTNDIAIAKRIHTPVKTSAIDETTSPIEESTDAIAQNQTEETQHTLLQAETLTGKTAADVETFSDENSSIASKYNIGETVVVVITPIAPGEETLTQPLVETESSVEEKAEKEKSFLAKLYGEYKHFKYGEKVDLKGIGVKDAMAKVDEGLFKEEREDVRDFVQRRIGRIQRRE